MTGTLEEQQETARKQTGEAIRHENKVKAMEAISEYIRIGIILLELDRDDEVEDE